MLGLTQRGEEMFKTLEVFIQSLQLVWKKHVVIVEGIVVIAVEELEGEDVKEY